MNIAIIGRTELLYDTALHLHEAGHRIVCLLTAKEAPEYMRTAADFQALAEQWNIPFAQGHKIVEHLEFLRRNAPEIAVSINYTGVVPQEVIDIFPLGVLNAHGGDLPRYRGNACQAWAILNGEEKIGLCIHRMIGGELDSGDIIARDFLKIDQSTKITKVWEWMNQKTPTLFLDAINKLSINPGHVIETQSKNPEDAHRCYPRKPEDGRIYWTQSALHILRLINASNKPYAGAFCEYEGLPFIIWDAELVGEYENFSAVPGQVTRICDGFIEVACGEGKLRILAAEYCGTIDSPHSWIRSIRKRLT